MGKTAFQPQTHGFAFINSFTFEPEEAQQMQMALSSSISGAATVAGDRLSSWAGRVLIPSLKQFTRGALPEHYGLCGGMACAALDYYLGGKPLPRGKDTWDIPTHNTPREKTLRSYLMRRQIDSVALNWPKMLIWIGMLNIDLPFVDNDGPRWLLSRTKEEWVRLKGSIDRGRPNPIMLVGSTANPFHNHQILAYGYDDPGDGTGTIYVYDMNCPGRENSIGLDMRGATLAAVESCANDQRGPLRGFFCNAYTPDTPPDL